MIVMSDMTFCCTWISHASDVRLGKTHIGQDQRIVLEVEVGKDRGILALVRIDDDAKQHVAEIAEELCKSGRFPEITRLPHLSHEFCTQVSGYSTCHFVL